MSGGSGTCEYVLDPDDPATWNGEGREIKFDHYEMLNENGVWNCPHDAEDGEELCLFHLPAEDKDDERVSNAFIDVLNKVSEQDNENSESRQSQFLGARFGEFDLSVNPPKIVAKDAEIVLSHITVERRLDWSETIFEVSNIHMRGVKFLSGCSFASTEFDGKVNFGDTEFYAEANFRSTVFRKEVNFGFAEFNKESRFSQTRFIGGASFNGAEFDKEAYFTAAGFGEKAKFKWAKFGKEAVFQLTEFQENAIFSEASFEKGADFSSSSGLTRGEFDSTDLTDAAFSDVALQNANFENALLSRATLLGADLRGAKLDGAVLGDVRIDSDTQFLGYPDEDNDSSPHTFSAIRSKPCCVYDPNYRGDNDERDVSKAKSVYRTLEELANKAARPRLQSQCFVRRQDLQKIEYKRDTKKADSWQERLIAGARYSRAKVARETLLYGESPWRVISGSVGFIIFAALLYPLSEWLRPVGGEPITYSRIFGGEPGLFLESLYFSTLTFTTLGMGDYEPLGVGQVLATLNTAFGAVLVALLVFVLGRRAAR